MTKTNSPADTIRANLKAAGYGRGQVSVKHDKYSMGSCLYVTIRDLSIPKSVVTAIAAPHENVRRDEATGEILCGGNRHLDVSYCPPTLREYSRSSVLMQLCAIPAGQAADVVVMGQTIRIAKIVNDRCAWQSEIVALDYQTDPDLRVRCHYDHRRESESDLVTAGMAIVELAIELAHRATIEHCCCSCGGTFAGSEVTVTEDSDDHQSAICHACAAAVDHSTEPRIPVLAPSACIPLAPFPAAAPVLRIVRDEPTATIENDWSIGL